MKCVCGYVHNEWGWDENEDDVIDITPEENNEEFIEAELTVSYYRNYNKTTQSVYICPKCGTLRVSV